MNRRCLGSGQRGKCCIACQENNNTCKGRHSGMQAKTVHRVCELQVLPGSRVGEIGNGLVRAGSRDAKGEQMSENKSLLYPVPTIAFGLDSRAERIVSKLLSIYSATDSIVETWHSLFYFNFKWKYKVGVYESHFIDVSITRSAAGMVQSGLELTSSNGEVHILYSTFGRDRT